MTDDLESIACKGILRFRDDVMGALSCYLNASGKAFTMSFKFADVAIMGIDSGDRRIQNVLNNDHNMYIRLRGPNPFIVLSFEGASQRDKTFISLLILASKTLGKFNLSNIHRSAIKMIFVIHRDFNGLHCST